MPLINLEKLLINNHSSKPKDNYKKFDEDSKLVNSNKE